MMGEARPGSCHLSVVRCRAAARRAPAGPVRSPSSHHPARISASANNGQRTTDNGQKMSQPDLRQDSGRDLDHHAEPDHDLYALPPDAVREPPRSLGRALLQIGPGLILAASIVGTGELINTTGLGA